MVTATKFYDLSAFVSLVSATFAEMLKLLCINCLVTVIQFLLLVWDVVTYPIYLVIQRPWEAKQMKWRQRSLQVDRKVGSWVVYESLSKPTEVQKELENGGIDTLLKLYLHLFAKFGKKKCVGTRPILSSSLEEDPKMKKMLTKLMLGPYEWLSYADVEDRATRFGRGLRKAFGLKAKDKVVMYADTSADWLVSAIGCFLYNHTIVTIYTNLDSEGIRHGVNQTEAKVIVTSQELLPKVVKVLPELSHVTSLVVIEEPWRGEISPTFCNGRQLDVYTYTELLNVGLKLDDNYVPSNPDDIAVIMYTSGSTGTPKGVMQTHKNILAALSGISGFVEHNMSPFRDDVYLAYLPLAHILEFLAENTFMLLGVPVGYGKPTTLTDSGTMLKAGCRSDAAVLRPTVLCGVPTVFERIFKGVKKNLIDKGPLVEKLVGHFIRYKVYWLKHGHGTPILDRIIFSKLKASVGGRVRFFLSGGAPLSPSVHKYIRAVLVSNLVQGYGLTETCATATIQDVDNLAVGNVGSPLQGVRVKLENWDEGTYTIDDPEGPKGEIVIGGDVITKGYYLMPEKTNQDYFTDDNNRRWFKTGDIGHMMPNGTLRVIDRKKDLVKLAHGEYVSLGKVETALKTIAAVDNICVYALPTESYVVAVVVPEQRVLEELALKLGKIGFSRRQLCEDSAVVDEVMELLNGHAVSARLHKFEKPKKIILASDQWTPESGVLTSAMKLKRKVIENKFRTQLSDLYSSYSHPVTNGVSNKKKGFVPV